MCTVAQVSGHVGDKSDGHAVFSTVMRILRAESAVLKLSAPDTFISHLMNAMRQWQCASARYCQVMCPGRALEDLFIHPGRIRWASSSRPRSFAGSSAGSV